MFPHILEIKKNRYGVYVFTIISVIYIIILYSNRFNNHLKDILDFIYSKQYGIFFSIFIILGLSGFLGRNLDIISKLLLFLHSLTYSFYISSY
jgi:hypothetical protein